MASGTKPAAGTTVKPGATGTKPATGSSATTLKQPGCGLDNCCEKMNECSYDDKVRLRAYQLWETAQAAASRGERDWPNPDGTEFWYAAEQELTHSDVTLEQIADET